MTRHSSKPRHEVAVQSDHQDQLGLERLIFFSNTVFAIAITLLALEIRQPETDGLLDNAQLSAQRVGMWHEYLACIISFLVIGTFWMAHHRKYRYINRYDDKLLFLSHLMLMIIAFIPFSSSFSFLVWVVFNPPYS